MKIHIWVYQIMRFVVWWHTEDDSDDEQYQWMVDDDFIDIKNLHGMVYYGKGFRKHKRMLKRRRNWYLRHGYFDLAEDLDTALWVIKK